MYQVKGILYLIPVPISDDNPESVGAEVVKVIGNTKFYIAERPKTARKFIKQLCPSVELQALVVEELTPESDVALMMKPIFGGHNIGLMSEAGNPCIADPGATVVTYAHKHHIQVVPLSGPSSILMALIASGFNGQQFTFHGYLPNKKETLLPRLKTLEQTALKTGYTQIFMETPYRNHFMIESLFATLAPNTLLAIACDLSSLQQHIEIKSISGWKKTEMASYHKRPAIFLIGMAQ
ncbi:MAG: SAM-dependent methyltransferase [Saprospiraceae bacterium]|nr:SAM-dependent methyltransferase [Saprospiraceae bacterium]